MVILVLGASLHHILTRLKAEPQTFPKLDLIYDPNRPVSQPVIVNLPRNGLRLRFDGPEQRMRLIEIVDFTKNHITFKDRDLVKPPSASPAPGESPLGPTFRHVYNRLLGPTYGGEYIPPQESGTLGRYVLSYPGVAFNFPLQDSAYSPSKDVVTLLSSPGSQVAVAMAVFSGDSWAHARERLWTDILPSIKTFTPLSKGKDVCPDEISLIKVHGAGKLQFFKNWSAAGSVWITLGETSPQDLVAELGPPDAIYRKNDPRMYIHKIRSASSARSRPSGSDFRRDELTDTDQSSAHTSDDSNEGEVVEDRFAGNISNECFFNYFYQGFDVLVSRPVPQSPVPPSQAKLAPSEEGLKRGGADRLVATKLLIHNNVPGSYAFNRHRRCRWEISYLPSANAPINSESVFKNVQERLHVEWSPVYESREEAEKQQRGMVLNRGWGDSPGSSIEFLGGWEGEIGARSAFGVGGIRKADGGEDSTTTLYGFPGLIFEVLRNDHVSALTVF